MKVHYWLNLLFLFVCFQLSAQNFCPDTVIVTDATIIYNDQIQAKRYIEINREVAAFETLTLRTEGVIDFIHPFETADGAWLTTENGPCQPIVDPVTQKPPPQIVGPFYDRENVEGDYVAVPITAIDGFYDPNNVIFEAHNLPPGLAINPDNGTVSGFIDSLASEQGLYVCWIIVRDKDYPQLSVRRAFYWTVLPPSTVQLRNSTPTNLDFGIYCEPLAIGNGYGRLRAVIKGPKLSTKYSLTYEWYKGDINSGEDVELLGTSSSNIFDLEGTGLDYEPGYYSCKVTFKYNNSDVVVTTETCSGLVGETSNVCASSCLVLGEDLPNSDSYCYYWKAIGNAYNIPSRTIVGDQQTVQQPDEITEYIEASGRVVKVCPSYPQYYDVVVTDGLSIIAEERYYAETLRGRQKGEKAELDVSINILPEGGVLCDTEEGSNELTLQAVVAGMEGTNYTYAWSTQSTEPSILINEVDIYEVTVTGDNKCEGQANIAPPVCESKQNTFAIKSCALEGLGIEGSSNSGVPHGGILDYADATQTTIEQIQAGIAHAASFGVNQQYLVSSTALVEGEIAPTGAKNNFETWTFSGDTDMLLWLEFSERMEGETKILEANLHMKFRDGFFNDASGALTEQEEAALRSTFIAGIKGLYECGEKSLEQTLIDKYGAVEPGEQNTACNGSLGNCADCMSSCISIHGLGPRGHFGFRFNNTRKAFNLFNLGAEYAGIWASLRDNLALPESIWKHDGESILYMYPPIAGLIDGLLQDNPITGLYEIGKLLLNLKAWENGFKAILNPIQTVVEMIIQAPQVWAAVTSSIDDFTDKFCGGQGCDVMMHTASKLISTIGMIAAETAFSGGGKLGTLASEGLNSLLQFFTRWMDEVNAFAPDIRERFFKQIEHSFACQLDGFQPDDVVLRSSDPCDKIIGFLKNYGDENQGKSIRDLFVDEQSMLEVYKDLENTVPENEILDIIK